MLFANERGEADCHSLRQNLGQYRRVCLEQHNGKQPIDSLTNEPADYSKIFEIYEQCLCKCKDYL